jgi:predicted ATPase
MEFEVELRNYRRFPVDRPARFILGPGFVSFVGVNNAGKSSLLRSFWEFRQLFNQLAYDAPFLRTNGKVLDQPPLNGVTDREEVFSNTNELGLDIRLTIPLVSRPFPADSLVIRCERKRACYSMAWVIEGEEREQLQWDGQGLVRRPNGEWFNTEPYREALSHLARSLYAGPFRNAVHAGGATHYDLEIGTKFIERWDTFKSGTNRAETKAAIHLTEEIKRIFRLDTLEINPTADGSSLQVIADGQGYRLDEQGAGLTQFVVSLAFAAVRKPSFFFIDEPELNLHPSLQLDFLTSLGTYTEKGVVFATHSLGLARASGSAIYSVRSIGPRRSEVREFEGTAELSEMLGELSFGGYQELGYSRVLLVEGAHEVPTFQRLLRSYGVDHQVVIVPLGGSTLINGQSAAQLEQLKRISDDIWVLIDSERKAPGEDLDQARAEFQENCEKLGFAVCVLNRRALENYLPLHAIQAVRGEGARILEPFETLAEVGHPWSKRENWKIAGHMSRADLADTDLGEFIDRLVEISAAMPTS